MGSSGSGRGVPRVSGQLWWCCDGSWCALGPAHRALWLRSGGVVILPLKVRGSVFCVLSTAGPAASVVGVGSRLLPVL